MHRRCALAPWIASKWPSAQGDGGLPAPPTSLKGGHPRGRGWKAPKQLGECHLSVVLSLVVQIKTPLGGAR